MTVRVKLYGDLRRFLPDQAEWIDIQPSPGLTIGALVDQLRVDRGEIGIFTINDMMVQDEVKIDDGDKVDIYAVIGGGR